MKSLPPDVAADAGSHGGDRPGRAAPEAHHEARRWGRIQVLEGSLRYRILEPVREEHVLSPQRPGIVEPEVPHEVELVGRLRFYLGFFRVPGTSAGSSRP